MRVCKFMAQVEYSCRKFIYYLTHKFPNDQRNLKKKMRIGEEFPREKFFGILKLKTFHFKTLVIFRKLNASNYFSTELVY